MKICLKRKIKLLPIISAEQRSGERRSIKGVILGKSGIGKTSLLWTLPAESTLFIDLEAGDLAVEGWQGDILRPRTWVECRNIAAFIGGANPSIRNEQCYSQAHFNAICQQYGERPDALDKYETIFIDSITVASRLSLQWCKGQPQATSQKTGKPDIRGAYGLHAQEMIAWITQLQYVQNKNIWLVGILDEKEDDFGNTNFAPQIEGTKTSLELPGIIDQLITMAELSNQEGKKYRAFICQTINKWNYPAKDRSGRLEMVEIAHLGQLMEKIKQPNERKLTYE